MSRLRELVRSARIQVRRLVHLARCPSCRLGRTRASWIAGVPYHTRSADRLPVERILSR